jgi:hypothetical protein
MLPTLCRPGDFSRVPLWYNSPPGLRMLRLFQFYDW